MRRYKRYHERYGTTNQQEYDDWLDCHCGDFSMCIFGGIFEGSSLPILFDFILRCDRGTLGGMFGAVSSE